VAGGLRRRRHVWTCACVPAPQVLLRMSPGRPDSLAFAMNGRLANPKTEEAPKPEEALVYIKGRRADKQPPSTAHAHNAPQGTGQGRHSEEGRGQGRQEGRGQEGRRRQEGGRQEGREVGKKRARRQWRRRCTPRPQFICASRRLRNSLSVHVLSFLPINNTCKYILHPARGTLRPAQLPPRRSSGAA